MFGYPALTFRTNAGFFSGKYNLKMLIPHMRHHGSYVLPRNVSFQPTPEKSKLQTTVAERRQL